jgi:addiction module HigA family antidote
MLRSLITIERRAFVVRVPQHRAPVHPGEVLVEEFLKPLALTQVALAKRLGIPFQRVNQICRGRRAVTPDTALRLARLFGTTVELWLNLQLRCDLYAAVNADSARSIASIRPLKRAS